MRGCSITKYGESIRSSKPNVPNTTGPVWMPIPIEMGPDPVFYVLVHGTQYCIPIQHSKHSLHRLMSAQSWQNRHYSVSDKLVDKAVIDHD